MSSGHEEGDSGKVDSSGGRLGRQLRRHRHGSGRRKVEAPKLSFWTEWGREEEGEKEEAKVTLHKL